LRAVFGRSPKNNTAATFRRWYGKAKHLKEAMFYTDDWNAFEKILSAERDNGNTRHQLGRFTRRTKVVSKSPLMVDLTRRLWNALTIPDVFKHHQQKLTAVFRETLSEIVA
jgi:IS1 family transposase